MQDTSPRDLPFRIDIKRVHLAVGWVAFGLPVSLLALGLLVPTICFYASISHFYFSPIGGDLFVGMLSFVGLLLLCLYSFDMAGCDGALGWRWYDVALIRIAGIAALLVAFVPTHGSGCVFKAGQVPRAFVGEAIGSEDFPFRPEPLDAVSGAPSFDFWGVLLGLDRIRDSALDWVHNIAAGVMFLILAYVVLRVFTRVNSEDALREGNRKDLRNRCYRALGLVILGAVAVLALKTALFSEAETFLRIWNGLRLTFVFEALALAAFGLAWMIKGRFLPVFEDRLHPRAA
ncbi:MAG: hypothetical protein CVT70_15425 [Alphaproteobacteria bacterium HGW-Alphaproteobacteria-1]|jgi:hypothetical protein|nr:MAG: hypothetical protein CVT70_15425 [Alphaproteobacteria bacterium HGW-Alphaproteobacteria-1]